MAKKVDARIPRGMRDILPDRMIRRQYVMDIIRTVFEEFGFEPLQTPVLELAETLMGKYGPDAERLIYSATYGQNQEKLALRYDLSVPLCRVIAMYPDLPKPFKRYQIAPVWRADRPQKGRYREFYQCDVDTVGSTSMLADAEIINVIYASLHRLGFTQFTINVSDRKIITGIGQYAGVADELLGGLYRSIDKLDKIGMDGVKNELRANEIPEAAIAKLSSLLEIEGSNEAILTHLREVMSDFPSAIEGIAEVETIIRYLKAIDIPEQCYKVNVSMVRGLEYYTGSIYETTIEEPKMPSITGGGRYDNLVGMFTERSFPAVGTSLGIERIIDSMEELNMFPRSVGSTVTQVLMTIFDAKTVDASLKMAAALRQGGLNTALAPENHSLGDQLRYASKKQIPFVVILGPDEVAKGQVVVKNMTRETQETVAQDQAVPLMRQWLREQA